MCGPIFCPLPLFIFPIQRCQKMQLVFAVVGRSVVQAIAISPSWFHLLRTDYCRKSAAGKEVSAPPVWSSDSPFILTRQVKRHLRRECCFGDEQGWSEASVICVDICEKTELYPPFQTVRSAVALHEHFFVVKEVGRGHSQSECTFNNLIIFAKLNKEYYTLDGWFGSSTWDATGFFFLHFEKKTFSRLAMVISSFTKML